MTMLGKIRHWLARSDENPAAGRCEHCGEYGLVCLNGYQFLCWKHYCEEMQAQRKRAWAN